MANKSNKNYNHIVNNIKNVKGINEDGSISIIEGRSKYAKRLHDEELLKGDFNPSSFIKMLPLKYEARATSKGIVVYFDKVRTLDIKVLDGRIKVFNHVNLDEEETFFKGKENEVTCSRREYLARYVMRIEENLPSYKAKDFTNATYIENKNAYTFLNWLLKRS